MPRTIRKDLIIEVCDKTGIKQQDVACVVDAFLESVMTHLGQGDDVALREFGTFELRVSRRKIGRNPKQPEITIHIPDKHVVRFKPGSKLEQLAAAVPVVALGLNHNHAHA
ncbi:MAG: HU family DNA-binding protein [Verrucomicrobiaceae bacterium]|jgi:nucleoid DNA-binding protein|nr:HU family DNA-binding protein [Verrucomicrobiaceae bacterium]